MLRSTENSRGKPSRMRVWHPRAPALREHRDREVSPTGKPLHLAASSLMAMRRTSARCLMNSPRNFKTLFLTMTNLSQQTMTNLSLYDIFDTGKTCDKIAEKCTFPAKINGKSGVFGKSLENSRNWRLMCRFFNWHGSCNYPFSVREASIKEVPAP